VPVHLKYSSTASIIFVYTCSAGFNWKYDLAPIQPRAAQMTSSSEESDFGWKQASGSFLFPVFILSPEIKISNGIGIFTPCANLKFSNTSIAAVKEMIYSH